MTNRNDLCDFHGGYCDPIGCDTARTLDSDGTMWCGQCEAGLIYKHRLYSNLQLTQLIAKAQEYLDSSGLSWDNRGTDQGGWMDYLNYSDAMSHYRREMKRREALMESCAGMLKDGYSLWGDAPND